MDDSDHESSLCCCLIAQHHKTLQSAISPNHTRIDNMVEAEEDQTPRQAKFTLIPTLQALYPDDVWCGARFVV